MTGSKKICEHLTREQPNRPERLFEIEKILTTGRKRIFASYLKLLSDLYPRSAKKWDLEARISPHLISFSRVELSRRLMHEAQAIVEAFHALRENPKRKQHLAAITPVISDPGNYSVLMSYDFHVDAAGQLRLIEINTNASSSLLVDALHRHAEIENPFGGDFREQIIATFRNEWKLALGNKRELKNIAIVDEKPLEQRMFIEFAFYREFFENHGLKVEFADPTELEFSNKQLKLKSIDSKELDPVDLVYNRHTDFYFQSETCQPLREAMESHATCITPHPFEYRLLADKERLLELSQPTALDEVSLAHKEIIKRTLIPTRDVAEFQPDELWQNRKRWFFKPKRSHGGKAVYRGSSVARSAFQQIINGNYVAQELVPPPTIKFGATAEEEFKYDLRFYAYRDKIQLACARLYRGQMTNAQTPGGGIALIDWRD